MYPSVMRDAMIPYKRTKHYRNLRYNLMEYFPINYYLYYIKGKFKDEFT
jgi:hypothetical protein